MLVRLTNNCTMNCSHCMVDASENGEHMDFELFKEVLKFNKQYDPMVLLISGGEPTEHPQFLEILEHLKMYNNKIGRVLILSNGLFLHDEIFTDSILAAGIDFQITNDRRYYPKRIKEKKHPLLTYEYSIHGVSPFARALKNKLTIERRAPHCFNFRSMSLHNDTFKNTILGLRSRFYFCTPSISVDGSITMGETPFCHRIGNIYTNVDTLFYNLINSSCDRCGLSKNLEDKFLLQWLLLEVKGEKNNVQF